MKKFIVIALIATIVGVFLGLFVIEPPESKVEPPPVSIYTSVYCYKVDDEHDGVTELRKEGYTVDYRDGAWYVNDVVVAEESAEDNPTELCVER